MTPAKPPKADVAKQATPKNPTKRKIATPNYDCEKPENEIKKTRVGSISQEPSTQPSNRMITKMLHPNPWTTYFGNVEFSDLIIICQGKKWKAHRIVMCDLTQTLKDMGAGSGKLDLSEYDPEIVTCLIEFHYTYDYSDGSTSSSTNSAMSATSTPEPARATSTTPITPTTETVPEIEIKDEAPTFSQTSTPSQVSTNTPLNPLTINTELYILGEKLHISHLKTLASKKFARCLSLQPPHSDFVDVLTIIQDRIDIGDTILRDLAVNYAVDNLGGLAHDENFKTFCEVFSANGFLLQMLVRMTDLVLKPCPKCGTNEKVKSLKKRRGNFKHYFSCGVCGLAWS